HLQHAKGKITCNAIRTGRGERARRRARACGQGKNTLAGAGRHRRRNEPPPQPVLAERENVVDQVITLSNRVEHAPDVAGPLIQAGLSHHISPVLRSGLSRETAPQILTYRTPTRPFRVKSREVAAGLAWVPGVTPSPRSCPLPRCCRWPRPPG